MDFPEEQVAQELQDIPGSRVTRQQEAGTQGIADFPVTQVIRL